jgi:peptidylprolyl isomerase
VRVSPTSLPIRRAVALFALAAATATPALLVTSTAGARTTTAASRATSGPLDKITVTAAAGAGTSAPALRFPKPLAVKTSTYKVHTNGTGEQPTSGAMVSVDYVQVDGRTGKTLGSSYGAKPQSLTLAPSARPQVLVKALLATKTGGQTIVAISPKDAKGLQASGSGVKKTDTLLFLLELRSVRHPLGRATGTAVTPPEGLPTVVLDGTGKPTITIPAGVAAPSTLVVQPLVVGTGPVVEAGQTVVVHYTGIVYGTGKQFDSSWDRGQTASFVIGQGQVIPGWDKGIVGQTVGSQLLLVIPPADGYGASGQSSAGITGTDTLVFVVDILDAY